MGIVQQPVEGHAPSCPDAALRRPSSPGHDGACPSTGRHAWRLLAGVALLLALAAPAAAQSGGNFTLRWSTIDGGGVTTATGGTFQLGGTIGQPDAASLSGGVFTLQGGFWAGAADTPTPTPTRTATGAATTTETVATATPTATPTRVSTATPTVTVVATGTVPTATATATVDASATITATVDGSVTPTATATATPSPTLPLSAPCVGDCDANGVVAVNELVLGVNIAVGTRAPDDCPAFDPDQSGTVLVNELIQGVNNALRGCASL